VNNKRKKTRPQEPRDLNFVVDNTQLTGEFLQRDVRVGVARHIVMATVTMLTFLGTAQTWFIDGAFKLVKAPFKQLYSVHAFVRSGTAMKQIPLAFVLMSHRRTQDYEAVFRAILEQLPDGHQVNRIVADFESAAWQALRVVLPNVELRGCLFHFTQAVYRKIQELGLTNAYMHDNGTKTLCKQLMSLPLLPHEHIIPIFDRLTERAGDLENLISLCNYVRNTWIRGPVFSPINWSVFGQSIRTNNDVEGWHYRMNHKGKRSSLPFYLL